MRTFDDVLLLALLTANAIFFFFFFPPLSLSFSLSRSFDWSPSSLQEARAGPGGSEFHYQGVTAAQHRGERRLPATASDP